jgi:DNA-binding transcriptional regulator YhcF (GntR family)
MVTVSPLRLLHSWREQHEAKRTHVLAEGILAVMRRHQADTRAELLFSTELLTKFVGAEPTGVFRALRKLERDGVIFTDDMTGRCILTDKSLLKR